LHSAEPTGLDYPSGSSVSEFLLSLRAGRRRHSLASRTRGRHRASCAAGRTRGASSRQWWLAVPVRSRRCLWQAVECAGGAWHHAFGARLYALRRAGARPDTRVAIRRQSLRGTGVSFRASRIPVCRQSGHARSRLPTALGSHA